MPAYPVLHRGQDIQILPCEPVSALMLSQRCLTQIYYAQSRPKSGTVPNKVSQKLDKLSKGELTLTNAEFAKQKPSSFGVYLGGFDAPVSRPQRRILNRWDLVIVDPFQPGVLEAISQSATRQVVGRVDLSAAISPHTSAVEVIEGIENTLANNFDGTALTGILLANWEGKCTPIVQKLLFEAIHKVGLSVYLETAPPHFLQDRNALQTDGVSGLVIRNASIMSNGEKCDYFQMDELQPTIKAFVSEACMRDFVVMAWETVDDDTSISNAVARRSTQWCHFYSAITWIGSQSALQNASLNTKTEEPLPAFGWLKEAEIMQTHDIWRSNLRIEKAAIDTAGWDALLPLFPSLKNLLASRNCQEPVGEALTNRVRDPPEWVAQVKPQGNPLSVSMSGIEYKAFGCFPLGSEATPVAFAGILQSQQRLKSLGCFIQFLPPRFRVLAFFSTRDRKSVV